MQWLGFCKENNFVFINWNPAAILLMAPDFDMDYEETNFDKATKKLWGRNNAFILQK